MAGKADVLAPGPLEDHPELSAKMKWRKLNGQSRPPRSSKGLNSATGSSTKSKPPDHAVTNFRA
jgi:hypothetical protein